MNDFHVAWPFMIPIVGTICLFTFLIVATLSRSRTRDLQIRERIAMIERGLMPPPEVDPRGFDRAMDHYERYTSRAPGRHRRAGVTLMGLGLGLMMLIGVAGGSMREGFGVGGFVAIMGLAFFINSRFDGRSEEYPPLPSRSSGAPGPIVQEPPRQD